MKKEDLYNANIMSYPGGNSGYEKVNQARARIQSIPSIFLPDIPDWLDHYPLVMLDRNHIHLRPSKEWVKLTHQEVKKEYQAAVNQDNEIEANRLMKGLVFLNKYYNSLPSEPDKVKRKPIGWHLARLRIRMSMWMSRRKTILHANAILLLAQKYRVDYEGNVWDPEW